jgi:prepilin-type N-terminal cleavage/methylation domain-containing protein
VTWPRQRAGLASEGGFTLIELLVVMFITGIIFTAFSMVISETISHSAQITSESVLENQARTALNQLTSDLREATPLSTSATSPFVTTGGVMSPTTITFYSPDSSYSTAAPTTYHLREISYQLSNGNFQRASALSSNTSTSSSWTMPALGPWVTLVPGVVNSVTFVYYNGNQPPAATTSPAAVRTVVVTLSLQVPGTTQDLTYSSTATLRETAPG